MNPPIKQGKRWKAGIYTQQTLSNIGEMHECITQYFNNPSDKYKQYGLARHNGIDLWYNEGTEVFACHGGVGVYVANDITGYGNYYRVTGEGFQTTYGHLLSGTANRTVKAGELIGFGDSTGNSSGHHLHLTVKRVDPNGNVINANDSMGGAVDPLPLITWWDNNEPMFQLVQVQGTQDVWLVKDVTVTGNDGTVTVVKKRSLVYNAGALLLISEFSNVQPISQSDLNAIQDSGKVLAALDQE